MIRKQCGVIGLVVLLTIPSIALGGPAEQNENSEVHWLLLPNILFAFGNVTVSVAGEGNIALGVLGLATGGVSIVDGWRVSDKALFLTGVLSASAAVVSIILWHRGRGEASKDNKRLSPIIWLTETETVVGAKVSF
jgi:hypothetical protein